MHVSITAKPKPAGANKSGDFYVRYTILDFDWCIRWLALPRTSLGQGNQSQSFGHVEKITKA